MKYGIDVLTTGVVVSLASVVQGDVTHVSIELFEPDVWISNGFDANALDTWRIYAEFDDPGEQLNAVFGNAANPLVLSTSDPDGFLNTEDFFGNGSLTAPFDQSPLHFQNLWDTFVTIDVGTSNNGDGTQLSPGFAELVGDLEDPFTLTNGAWFVTVADLPQGVAPPGDGRVLVAQVTVGQGHLVEGVFNFQIAGGAQFTNLAFTNLIPAPATLAILAPVFIARRRRTRHGETS